MMFCMSAERLMKAGDVSEAKARSIAHWHDDCVNNKLARRLFKTGVNSKS